MAVYLINERGTDRYKIGVSSDPERRLSGMQTSNAGVLDLIHTWPGGLEAEKAVHEEFDDLRLSGEWFALDKTVLPHVLMFLTNQTMEHRLAEEGEAGVPLSPSSPSVEHGDPGVFWDDFIRCVASLKVSTQKHKILIPRSVLKVWYDRLTGACSTYQEFIQCLREGEHGSSCWSISNNRTFGYRSVAWVGDLTTSGESFHDWNELENRRGIGSVVADIKRNCGCFVSDHNTPEVQKDKPPAPPHASLFEAHSEGVIIPGADTILFSDGSTVSWDRSKGCWVTPS